MVEAFDGLSGTLDQIDTGQLANSLDTLSETFRDTPPEIRGALDGLSRLSTTIASRDEEIRRLLAGTHELAGVLADRNAEVEKLLKDGNLLLGELQRRREAISRLLDGTIALSEQLRGLVADNKDQLRPTLEQLDRVAALLQRNKDALGSGIRDLAVFVRLFANATGNGEWFDNYICGAAPAVRRPDQLRGVLRWPLTTTDRRQLQLTGARRRDRRAGGERVLPRAAGPVANGHGLLHVGHRRVRGQLGAGARRAGR